MSSHTESGYVVFYLGEELYGLPCGLVEGLVRPDRIHPVPRTPEWIAGVACLRGRELPVLDLRARLGYRSAEADCREFQEMMAAREQDHRDWLATLEKCVAEGQEFTLATDPHKCRFGLWYDHIRTRRLSGRMQRVLDRFDEPHRAVHGVADTVMGRVRAGDVAGAVEAMDATRRQELAAMVDLFSQVRREYAVDRSGMVMITRCGDHAAGLLADRVVAVSPLTPAESDAHAMGAHGAEPRFLEGICRDGDGELVMVVDAAAVASRANATPAVGLSPAPATTGRSCGGHA
jgi:chemotaxis signal transduction protein